MNEVLHHLFINYLWSTYICKEQAYTRNLSTETSEAPKYHPVGPSFYKKDTKLQRE